MNGLTVASNEAGILSLSVLGRRSISFGIDVDSGALNGIDMRLDYRRLLRCSGL